MNNLINFYNFCIIYIKRFLYKITKKICNIIIKYLKQLLYYHNNIIVSLQFFKALFIETLSLIVTILILIFNVKSYIKMIRILLPILQYEIKNFIKNKLPNHFFKVLILLYNGSIFLIKWSINYYFKALFLLVIIFINIIAIFIFYNNYNTFIDLSSKWKNSITVLNTPFVINTLISKFQSNNYYRYQHISVNIKKLNDIPYILYKYNISKDNIDSIYKIIIRSNILEKLNNIKLNLTLVKAKKSNYNKVLRINIPINYSYDFIIKSDNTKFYSSIDKAEVVKYLIKKRFIIHDNYYESANNSDIPKNIVAQISNVLSWHIDFQREINPGDSVEVLYECTNNTYNNTSYCKDLLYVTVKLHNSSLSIYKFDNKYYLPNGRSAATILLRTPIDGARITSPFGKRIDPILGYSAFHKGVDFGAPTGTPIPAAGDGIVVRVSISNSYGKNVEIRHNAYLSTVYAHMNAFAKGLHLGEHVTQRQIIGYVGSTGWATGPHLHYEIHFNGNPVNPTNVRLASSDILTNNDLANFLNFKNTIDLMTLRIPNNTKFFTNQ